MPEAVALPEERGAPLSPGDGNGDVPRTALERASRLLCRGPVLLALGTAVAAAAILAVSSAHHRLAHQAARLQVYEQALEHAERRVAALRADKAALVAELASRPDPLVTRARIAELRKGIAERQSTVIELRRRQERLERRLDTARREREAAVVLGRELNGRLAALEQRAEQLTQALDLASAGMRRWIGGPLAEFEELLGEAGLDLADLVDRASEEPDRLPGRGGPLEPLGEERAFEIAALEPTRQVLDDLRHLDTTRRLLAALPLSAPFESYQVTSRFGVRRDPLTGRRAVHRGLDLVAPRGTAVSAPAAGRVLSAGRFGAYGIMVEIDHGLGIVSRYGHLRRALVEKGQTVEAGTPIGIIGSSGRSTGRHLHYEVLLDGREIDPEALIEAGRRLALPRAG